MTSVLRQLQAEWNQMVPAAQARGVRRVRLLGGGDVSRGPLESIAHRRAKVEWLRAILGTTALSGFSSLTFGVEIECILPQGWTMGKAAAEITAAGVLCFATGYDHATPPVGQWKVVYDGSLRGNGAEFVSPPLRGEEGFRQLQVVCDALTQIGAKITSRCGLHVHVGVGSEGVDFFKNLVTLYSSAQQAIDTFMPQSRRSSENAFCRPVSVRRQTLAEAASVGHVVQAIGQTASAHRDSTRYCKLNLKSFFAYGTVEFRHHGGTVDAVKAQNWVRLCLRMVLTARAGEQQVSSVDELLEAVGADQAERDYFRSRVQYFSRGSAADNFATYGSQTAPRRGHVDHQPVSNSPLARGTQV